MEDCKDIINEPSENLSEEDQMIKREQKKFLNIMFQQQFPEIIEIILIYSQRPKIQEIVQDINNRVVQLVLKIMKDKNDFENILKKLKNEFRGDKKNQILNSNQAKTREIVVNWYIVLFKNFDTNLIDNNKDIFVTLIENIDFQFPTLVQKIIDLVCMLSVKNEDYFREVMKWLIQRFHYSKKEINQEKLNQIITCLCNSIKPEKVFMEFATIFHKMTDLGFV